MPEATTQPAAAVVDALLTVRNVIRTQSGRRLIDDISLQLRRGESLAILGANGAGKSTLMAMLAGSLPVDSGDIQIDGHDLREAPLLARASIGFLPERPPVYNELTTREYLRFCMQLRSHSGDLLDRGLDGLLERLRLDSVADRLIGNLSLGFRNRVGIAQAVMHQPSLLILDEPMLGLDPHELPALQDDLSKLRDGRAILISSHSFNDVAELCDRAIILQRGRIVDSFAVDASSAGEIAERFASFLSAEPASS